MKNLKICLIIIILLLFSTIYFFSNRTADQSNKDSTNVLIKLRLVKKEEVDTNSDNYRKLHTLIRVFAHFLIYAILTLFIYLLIYVLTKKDMIAGVTTFLIVFLLAIFDEKHQLAVEGRSFEVFDIFIDSCGALLTLITSLSVNLVNKILAKKSMKEVLYKDNIKKQ